MVYLRTDTQSKLSTSSVFMFILSNAEAYCNFLLSFNFQKKLLCRQLHEAESLMMVQRLDWDSKIKESQLHDYGTDALKETPHHHVPLIHVPNDFPLFVHDPVHRTGSV